MSHIFLETRMFRLSGGEEIMTLAFFVLIQYRSVTNGRTDRQTDRQTDIPPLAIPAVCITRYANALVKTEPSGLVVFLFFFVCLTLAGGVLSVFDVSCSPADITVPSLQRGSGSELTVTPVAPSLNVVKRSLSVTATWSGCVVAELVTDRAP